jgi:energy-coupling factor transport system ATP-binding protein
LKTPAISINNLTFSYGSRNISETAGSRNGSPDGFSVLEDINLSIADNEFTAIIGRNGGGKTTLLKNIAGLLRPTGGEVYIRGKNAREMSVPEIAGEIGFVMQNPDRQLFTATVYDEAAYALRNAKLPEKEIKPRVEAALQAVGLAGETDSFPPGLGRGDRAKAVIASVLAMGSKILILDEPAAGQDYRNSRLIMNIVQDLHERGYTIIFVTHTMLLVAEYARRVIVLKEKRVFMDGPVADIFSRTGELAGAGILPPEITRLSRQLRKELPLEKDALSAAELGDMLLGLIKRPGAG